MVIKLRLCPYTQHILLSEKDIWDFIDLDNRNLTTRFGSDLSVVSRIKPLFDCYVRTIRLTISDWHKAITWLWQFPNWSRPFIRHLRQNWRKLEHVEGVWTLLMIMTGSFQDSRGEVRWLLRGRKWRYFQSKYHPLRAVFAGLGTPQMGLGVKRAVTWPGRGDNHRVKARQILTFCWAIFHSLLPSRPPLYHLFYINPHIENFLALSWLMDKSLSLNLTRWLKKIIAREKNGVIFCG